MYRPLIASLGLVPALVAQSDNFFPDYAETSFSDRSGLNGSSAGDVLMRLSTDALGTSSVNQFQPEDRGILQTVDPSTGGVIGIVRSWQVVLQDQQGNTPAAFTMVVIPDTGTGAPDATRTLQRTGPLSLPRSTATGPVAWLLTGGFGTTPVTLPVGGGNVYYGVGLPARATWPSDGLSVHGAWQSSGAGGGNANANAPQLCFTIHRTAGGAVAQPAEPRWHQMFLGGPGPVHVNGADILPQFQRGPNPAFGGVGNWPDHSNRADGLAFRIRDVNRVGANVATIGSIGGFGPPTPAPGAVEGLVCLDLRTVLPVIFTSGTLRPPGVWHTISMPAPLAVPLPNLTFQSFLLDVNAPTAFIATNAAQIHPL